MIHTKITSDVDNSRVVFWYNLYIYIYIFKKNKKSRMISEMRKKRHNYIDPIPFYEFILSCISHILRQVFFFLGTKEPNYKRDQCIENGFQKR